MRLTVSPTHLSMVFTVAQLQSPLRNFFRETGSLRKVQQQFHLGQIHFDTTVRWIARVCVICVEVSLSLVRLVSSDELLELLSHKQKHAVNSPVSCFLPWLMPFCRHWFFHSSTEMAAENER